MLLFQLLLMVLLTQAEEPVCRLQGHVECPEFQIAGDLIIGGIFSFRTRQDGYIDSFRNMPEVRPCWEYVYIYQNILFNIYLTAITPCCYVHAYKVVSVHLFEQTLLLL